jgi:hypothetical protein
MKSFRDVYRKFLHTSAQGTGESGLFKGCTMPFFYLKNNNFCALFMHDEQNRPSIALNPSKYLV